RKELLNSFRVNDFITLKMVGNRTNIYVKGQLFNQCKYLLLNISRSNLPQLHDIESIDDAAERLDRSMEGHEGGFSTIPPETEFWGHCSNMQAWVENNYDTRILHRNLAFPLLRRLTEVGDPRAKEVFRKEILKRVESGYPTVVQYLLNQGYLRFLKSRDIDGILDNILEGKLEYWQKKSLREVVQKFASFGSSKAKGLLEDIIKDEMKRAKIRQIQQALNRNEFRGMKKTNIEEIYNNIEERLIDLREFSLKINVLKGFADLHIDKALEQLKSLIIEKEIGHDISTVVSYFDSGYLNYFNNEELGDLIDLSSLESAPLSFDKILVYERLMDRKLADAHNLLINSVKKGFSSKKPDLIRRLINQDLLKYLDSKDLDKIFEEISKNAQLKTPPLNYLNILRRFINYEVNEATTALKAKIKSILKSGNTGDIKNLFKYKYSEFLTETDLNDCFKELDYNALFEKDINNAIRLVNKFGKNGLENHQEIIKEHVAKLLKYPNEDTISSVLNKSVIKVFSNNELKAIVNDKNSKTIEKLFEFVLTNRFKSYVRKKIIRFFKKIRPLSNEVVSEKVVSSIKNGNLEELCNFIRAHFLELLNEQEKANLLNDPSCLLNQFIVFYHENEYHVDYNLNLDLSNQNITNLEEVEGLENLIHLKKLDLRNNRLVRIRGLGKLKNLKKLRLRNNPLSQNIVEYLGGIDRYGNAKNPQQFVKYCEKVEKGEIKTIQIHGKSIELFEDELILKNNKIKDLKEIEGLFELSNLQVLDLSHNHLENVDGIENLSSLRVLNLSHNRIKETKGIEKLQKLEELRLYGNGISEFPEKKVLKNLTLIDLDSKRKITDKQYLNYMLQSLSVKEIKKICRDYNVRGYSRFNRQGLINFTIQSLAEEEQREKIGELSLQTVAKNIDLAMKIINYNHTESIEHIEIVNSSNNDIEILFKGFNWETKSFLSFNKHNIDDPTRDCDCRIGRNMGFCSHFWVGFIYSLKKGYFNLSDWTLTPLIVGFEKKIEKFEIIKLPSGKETLANKEYSLGFLLNHLGKKVLIHQASLSEFNRREYEWNGKTIVYYLNEITNVKISSTDKKDDVHHLDRLLVRFSDKTYKRFKLKTVKKINLSGIIQNDSYLGIMLKNVFIGKLDDKIKVEKSPKKKKSEKDPIKKDEILINLAQINDDLRGNWWTHINISNFKYYENTSLTEKYTISEGDILIHKEIKPGDRFPSVRYHLFMNKRTNLVENNKVKEHIIKKLIEFTEENDFMPLGFKIIHKYKNGNYKINYKPSQNVKFSLNINPHNYNIFDPDTFFKESNALSKLPDIDQERELREKSNDLIWRIESHSDPNKKYTIKLQPNGRWTCTCPHHIFRKAICKHIKEVQRKHYRK
ncbi:MAG: hypothetical protein GF317_12650, partial [Candidatus Lokiarchaeota archaeon]|nr:hypothetical protein [Candidatus Lokiarchaeota archaeon]MBD3200497.1 hypothetical protein [Candidatus Lokiarchaeota archaeon]